MLERAGSASTNAASYVKIESMAGLQDVVDSLNRRLRCAVVVDSLIDNTQYYNTQNGQLDQSRTNRILTRGPNAAAAAYFQPFRSPIPEAPIRIPANPDLGIEARVYMPVRYEGDLLGHLWVLDPEARVPDSGLEAVRTAAEAAGLILNRQVLLADLERSRERELLRDLLSFETSMRAQAAREMVEANLFVSSSAVQVIAVQLFHPEGLEISDARRADLARSLDAVRSDLTAGHAIHLVRNDHALVVVALQEPSVRSEGIGAIAETIRRSVEAALEHAESAWQVLTGIGGEAATLAECAASYEQALTAIRVSRVVPIFAPVAEWRQLGIYSLLSRLPVEQLSADVLHPGLLRLLQQEDHAVLVQTLESYLDAGCDAQKTSALLFVHRTTLYYRMHKIEALAEVDLASGEDRLALHLSLKLARLAGILAAG